VEGGGEAERATMRCGRERGGEWTRYRKIRKTKEEKRNGKKPVRTLDGSAALSRPLDLHPTRASREHRVRHRSAQARDR
jgi:hypothetical protein